jgi:hypothetical protein
MEGSFIIANNLRSHFTNPLLPSNCPIHTKPYIFELKKKTIANVNI